MARASPLPPNQGFSFCGAAPPRLSFDFLSTHSLFEAFALRSMLGISTSPADAARFVQRRDLEINLFETLSNQFFGYSDVLRLLQITAHLGALSRFGLFETLPDRKLIGHFLPSKSQTFQEIPLPRSDACRSACELAENVRSTSLPPSRC